MRKTYCVNCQYYSLNFWGYIECWKFDRELDMKRTLHTATREKDALRFNQTNDCKYFVRRHFKWFRYLFCKHSSIHFIRNLYGKEIEVNNGCRSYWECDSCGMPIYKDNFVPKNEWRHERTT